MQLDEDCVQWPAILSTVLNSTARMFLFIGTTHVTLKRTRTRTDTQGNVVTIGITSAIKWVVCHYGAARPQVADKGGGFQIWKVAANIVNKQSRIEDNGWPSNLWVESGANNFHRKK
jgi:hypothetical protein